MREVPVFRKSGHIYTTSVGVIQTHPDQNLLGSGAMIRRLWSPCVMVFMCPNCINNFGQGGQYVLIGAAWEQNSYV